MITTYYNVIVINLRGLDPCKEIWRLKVATKCQRAGPVLPSPRKSPQYFPDRIAEPELLLLPQLKPTSKGKGLTKSTIFQTPSFCLSCLSCISKYHVVHRQIDLTTVNECNKKYELNEWPIVNPVKRASVIEINAINSQNKLQQLLFVERQQMGTWYLSTPIQLIDPTRSFFIQSPTTMNLNWSDIHLNWSNIL